MGRDKGQWLAVQQAAASAEATKPESREDVTSCGICNREVALKEEDHITGHCSRCGRLPFHIPCVQSHLERTLRPQIREGGFGTKAWEKVQQKIKQRPQDMFARNGTSQKLPVSCPACQEGIMEAADIEKPVRKKLAPPPAPLPAPKPRGVAQKAAAAPPSSGSGGIAAIKKAASAATAAPSAAPKRAAPSLPQPGARLAASMGMSKLGQGQGSGRQGPMARTNSWASASSGGGAGGGSTGADSHVPKRPAWLQMCRDQVEDGACYTYNCEYCHSREEQEEREADYLEEQREAARQRRQAELEEQQRQAVADADAEERAATDSAVAAAAAAAAAEREQRRQAAEVLRDVLAREEATLALADDTLALMKRHKRSLCITALLEMGFDDVSAAAAADASGGEPIAAADLLMEGRVASGDDAVPTRVIREAKELLAFGATLGLAPPAVEAALVVSAGDWQQARWELQQQATAAAVAAAVLGPSAAAGTAGGKAGAYVPSPVPVPLPAVQGSSTSFTPQALTYGGAQGVTAGGAAGVAPAWQASALSSPGMDAMDHASAAPWAAPPQPQPLLSTSTGAGGADAGFDAGFAAGLAAAMATAAGASAGASSSQPDWQPQHHQAHALATAAAVPAEPECEWLPPQMDREHAAEEEIDDLMAMLGIAG